MNELNCPQTFLTPCLLKFYPILEYTSFGLWFECWRNANKLKDWKNTRYAVFPATSAPLFIMHTAIYAMPVYKYDMSVHRFAYQPCSMCVCVYVCGWHVLCAAKGPSLEKFSTCHLFRHQLNLKSNQTGCCLFLCLSSTGLSLYISSGCLLSLLHLPLLSLSFSVVLLLCPPLACVPTCPILSLFLMLFICPSSACIFLQHVACFSSFWSPNPCLCCASALLFK